MLSLPAFLAITFATAIQTVFSFYGYKKFVFKSIKRKSHYKKPVPYLQHPTKRSETTLWIVAFVLFITNVAFKYRGEFTDDSANLLKSVHNFAGFWEKER